MPSTRKQTGSMVPAVKRRKSFWLKQLHTWHWMSSAISLIGLLLFALTGITLNHAASIEAAPVVVPGKAELPATLRPLVATDSRPDHKGPLPRPVAEWVAKTLKFSEAALSGGEAEWSTDDVYLALPRPGGDAWVSIDRASGAVTSETTRRGWISYLNDLHKGRNAGDVWKYFIDIYAGACFIFALTGFFLLQLHAAKRPSTWPLVAAGLILPAILAMYFIH